MPITLRRSRRSRSTHHYATLCLLFVALVAGSSPTRDAGAVTAPTLPPREGGPPAARSPAAELVRRLVDKPPRQMSELEAIVGPIKMSFANADHENMGHLMRPRPLQKGDFTPLVPSLSIKYAWDMYHQDPSRPRDVPLEEYKLRIRGEAAMAEQILGATQKHPFYITREAGGTFELAWYAQVPRFAIPVPDAKSRAAWLASLAQRIASARSIDEIDAFCKQAPKDAGIEIVGTLNSRANPNGLPAKDPRDYWLKFVPPVGAKVVAGAFGWGEIVGVSHDVHMSSWHVQQANAKWYPTGGAEQQWEIDASFSHRPSGTRSGSGPSASKSVTDEDELYGIAVRPRFK